MNTLLNSISKKIQTMLHNDIDRNLDQAMAKIKMFEKSGLADRLDDDRGAVFDQLKTDVIGISDHSASATTLRDVARVYGEMCKLAWVNRKLFDDMDDELNLYGMYGEMFNVSVAGIAH